MAPKYRGSIEIDPGAKLKKKRDFPWIRAQLLNWRTSGGQTENSHFSWKMAPFQRKLFIFFVSPDQEEKKNIIWRWPHGIKATNGGRAKGTQTRRRGRNKHRGENQRTRTNNTEGPGRADRENQKKRKNQGGEQNEQTQEGGTGTNWQRKATKKKGRTQRN